MLKTLDYTIRIGSTPTLFIFRYQFSRLRINTVGCTLCQTWARIRPFYLFIITVFSKEYQGPRHSLNRNMVRHKVKVMCTQTKIED